jgi:hypothetical protein
MSATSRPSVDQLKRAIKLSEKIQKLEAQLAAILGTSAAPTAVRAYVRKGKSSKGTPGGKKRVISPEGKERIAAAQRLRWAKLKKAKKAS